MDVFSRRLWKAGKGSAEHYEEVSKVRLAVRCSLIRNIKYELMMEYYGGIQWCIYI